MYNFNNNKTLAQFSSHTQCQSGKIEAKNIFSDFFKENEGWFVHLLTPCGKERLWSVIIGQAGHVGNLHNWLVFAHTSLKCSDKISMICRPFFKNIIGAICYCFFSCFLKIPKKAPDITSVAFSLKGYGLFLSGFTNFLDVPIRGKIGPSFVRTDNKMSKVGAMMSTPFFSPKLIQSSLACG